MDSTKQPDRLDRLPRREWQTPHVMHSALADSEVKLAGAPTPDSHFISNDYGSVS